MFENVLGEYAKLPVHDKESKVLDGVKEQKQDHNGKLIRVSNENPFLNTLVYNVENPDGHIDEYTANFIAEILYNQVYADGYSYRILYEIVGDRKIYDATLMESGKYDTIIGVKMRVITTKVWKLKVNWDQGANSYISLRDIKEINPVEVAEYSELNKINK